MAKPKKRTHLSATKSGAKLFGNAIALARKKKKMSMAELAERMCVSRNTVSRIEGGETGCEIGLVFDAAHIVGLSLFHDDDSVRVLMEKSVIEQLALLPSRTHIESENFNDDF